jgi:hypothetical protein
MTVEELLTQLGVPAETLTAKADIVNGFKGELTASQAAAQKKLEDAQALDRVINDNIEKFGLNETTNAQLRANNAALTAALAEVKKAGFTGITIPDLPAINSSAKNPMDELTGMITKGFTQMGQTMNEMNRYQRITGKFLPEDPATLADKAASARLSVHDYMEQTYKLSDMERTQVAEATAKREAEVGEKAVKAWQEAHPNTSGHPELNGGLPSNYPAMPAPRDAKSVREFSTLSTRDKIAGAMKRASEAVGSRNVA